MSKRRSKTREEQERYYEVDDFFSYMVDVLECGMFDNYKELYKELRKTERINFLIYVSECFSQEFMKKALIHLPS